MAQETVGVEEEYQLLDAESGALRPVNDLVLDAAAPAMGESVHPELLRSQVEVSTPVCTSLDELDRELRGLRRRLNAAAQRYGCRLGAAGTHPSARWETQEVTAKERYLSMAEEFQQMAREMVIFGCHVHVGVEDPEVRIQVMNGIRWALPTLLALTVNSPFFGGQDTGYSSYRTMVFRRWPTTGMPERFAGLDEYDRAVGALVNAGAIEDATHLYWDVRPSVRFPTLEARIADVCLTVDEAVTLAGLISALVTTTRLQVSSSSSSSWSSSSSSLSSSSSGSGADIRHELLEAAVWRAARHGLDDQLIDAATATLRPAGEEVEALLTTLRPALEEAKSWERVFDGVRQILAQGTGAARQRAIFKKSGSLTDVIHYIADQTAGVA
jgi:carboxylate-amine ligase